MPFSFNTMHIPLQRVLPPPPNVLLDRQVLPPHEPPSVHHPCCPPPNELLQRQLLPPHQPPSVHHPCSHPPNELLQRQLLPPRKPLSVHHACPPPHYGRRHSTPPYLNFLNTAKELGLLVVDLVLYQPTLVHHP
ncbi:hypothetical protein V8G54_027155, partial [Vigna mungo]